MNTAPIGETLTKVIQQSIAVKQKTLEECAGDIEKIADALLAALRGGHKILLFGNGGSAADAQHVAGEFVGRFLRERRPLAAVALNTDTALLTCIGNDYDFADIFARQVEALANTGDVVVGISTSGNSENVRRGIAAGRARGATTIGFTGGDGGKLKAVVDLCLCIPSPVTARIQETQITVWHVLCGHIDDVLFGAG